jgi:hypothetical protein
MTRTRKVYNYFTDLNGLHCSISEQTQVSVGECEICKNHIEAANQILLPDTFDRKGLNIKLLGLIQHNLKRHRTTGLHWATSKQYQAY